MSGELLGVTATDALELGIDIGSLDCAISVGFPGTVSSLRQQWGRAGRRSPASRCSSRARTRSTSTSCASPRRCSARTVEAAILDHANPRVLDGHVLSAAFEGPIDEADAETLGPEALERAASLPELKLDRRGLGLGRQGLPGRARQLLRSGELDSFTVVDAETGTGARHRRALARLLDGPRRRRLPPPRRAAPRPPARRRRAHGARQPAPTVDWYTQAKKETADRDRRAAAHASSGSGSSSSSAASR